MRAQGAFANLAVEADIAEWHQVNGGVLSVTLAKALNDVDVPRPDQTRSGREISLWRDLFTASLAHVAFGSLLAYVVSVMADQ